MNSIKNVINILKSVVLSIISSTIYAVYAIAAPFFKIGLSKNILAKLEYF